MEWKAKSMPFKRRASPFETATFSSWSSLKERILKFGSSQTLSTYFTRDSTISTEIDLFNIQTPLPTLPQSLWKRILSYLSPKELARCESICHGLRYISLNPDLWQMHCINQEFHKIPGIELLWEKLSKTGDKRRWWKEIYLHAVVGKQNWINGNHKKLLFQVTEEKDAITCFKFDTDKIVIGSRKKLVLAQTEAFIESNPIIQHKVEFKGCHRKTVLCLDFGLASEYLLATADVEGNLGLWNIYTGELLARRKRVHETGISCLKILKSKLILTCGFDGKIRLSAFSSKEGSSNESSPNQSQVSIKIPKMSLFQKIFKAKFNNRLPCSVKLIKEYQGHKGEIYCMALISDFKFATGATDYNIKLWDISKKECERTLKGHGDIVSCLCFSQGYLFSGSLDKTIRKWNYKTGQCLAVFNGHEQWIKSICINGSILASGGWEETIFLWDVEKCKIIRKIKMDMGPISNIQCNESRLLTACREEGFQNQIAMLDFGKKLHVD